jgi:hypothetical protein
MAHGENPTKTLGSEKFFPCLQQCIDGYRKQDPASHKKLPVEADVPEYLIECVLDPSASELDKAVGDLSLIAFYYLLRVGEYTVKGKKLTQNKQFNSRWRTYVSLKKKRGGLRCLPRHVSDKEITAAMGAVLKLDNQKNRWKGVSIYHETNGDPFFCLIKAIGQ